MIQFSSQCGGDVQVEGVLSYFITKNFSAGIAQINSLGRGGRRCRAAVPRGLGHRLLATRNTAIHARATPLDLRIRYFSAS
ncbi:hypothetical protein [Bradyrhizobium sp. LMTR 3]|uniref:hypothetical protein n=1 Tax=Bradyrhizobium sp. LMTR 3 TaxID=189873 RepID=UPI001146FB63|nr:hypothetical protein [Bradyrhizobium sp. LMTR 3]